MRPLSRQKRMKQVLESEHPKRVSKSRPVPGDVDHLNNTVLRRRLREVQLSVRMTKFPQRRRCLRVTPQHKIRGDADKGSPTR